MSRPFGGPPSQAAQSPRTAAPIPPKHDRNDSPMDQLDTLSQAIHHHLERPYEFMRREIELFRSIISNFNLVLGVGAFIAGVQSSVMAFTRTLDPGGIQRAASWFAFVGLVLDVLGTSTGIVRSLTLQRAITSTERTRTTLAGDASRIQQHVVGLKAKCQRQNNTIPDTDIQNAVDEFHRHTRICQKFEALYDLSLPVNQLRSSKDASQTRNISRPSRKGSSRSFVGQTFFETLTILQGLADLLPIASLGFGLSFLLVSIILLAVASQPKEVWLTCVIVAGVVISGVSTSYALDADGGRRKQLCRELDDYNRQDHGNGLASMSPNLF